MALTYVCILYQVTESSVLDRNKYSQNFSIKTKPQHFHRHSTNFATTSNVVLPNLQNRAQPVHCITLLENFFKSTTRNAPIQLFIKLYIPIHVLIDIQYQPIPRAFLESGCVYSRGTHD